MSGDRALKEWMKWSSLLPPLLLGSLLRFAGLGKQPLFLDEAFTADLVLRSWWGMVEATMADVHPPLFYALLKLLLIVFPLSEWTLRLLSAVSSVLALALAMGLVYRLAGRETAAMTGWLLSWSSLHLYYAQDARMYALLDVWWTLSSLLLLSALWHGNGAAWIGWSIVVVAAVYTHFYGLVLWGVGACCGGLLILSRRRWGALREWGIAQALVLIAVAPLTALLIKVTKGGVGGTWVPSWKDPLDLFSLMLVGFTPVHNHFLNGHLLVVYPWGYLSRDVGEALSMGLVGVALLGWRRARGENARRLGWIVGVQAVLPLVLVTLLLYITGRRFWAYRPFIGVATLAAAGLAAGWCFLLDRRLRAVLLGLLLVLNLGSLWAYQFRWIKDYGRLAFSEALPDRTALLLDRYYTAYVFHFYRPEWDGDLFGLVPQSDRAYEVVQIFEDGTLRGRTERIACDELPMEIALYDPAGRRFNEGSRWPSCLRERAGWLFDPGTGRWEKVARLIP